MKKKELCLVIGANGFIGSHLVDELVEAGYRVRAFDRFTEPPKYIINDAVDKFVGDIFDDIAIHGALKDIDYVFHSFSATTPITSDTDPYADITLNILRNVQIFEQLVENSIKKLVFISSGGAVYGPVAEHKNASEMDAPLPVSPYGIGKLGTEYYLAYFNRKYNLEYISYRLTNPYGPRQFSNSQGVIPIFISKIKSDEKITIYGDGTGSRDYIYVRDATKMMVESFSKDTKYTTYNIGSGQQTSLNEIVASIENVVDRVAKVSYKEAPKTFLKKTQVSIDRFVKEFNLKPTTTLLEGLEKTIEG